MSGSGYIGTEQSLIQFMSESTTENDWGDRYDIVVRFHGGNPPSFWYSTIVISGVMGKTASKWKGSDKIRIR